MKAGWKGGVEVTDVDLQDRVNKDDFLNWKRLGLSGMNISVAAANSASPLAPSVMARTVAFRLEAKYGANDATFRPDRSTERCV